MNGIAACSFGCGRSVFFRGLGKALAIASRTIRRCTFTFLATPAIVPTPNSYSRRISSNSSTLALHSNGLPLPGNARIRVSVRCQGGPIQTAEMGQFRLPKSIKEVLDSQIPHFESLDTYSRYLAEKGLRAALSRRWRLFLSLT